jgi:hypothetical protein
LSEPIRREKVVRSDKKLTELRPELVLRVPLREVATSLYDGTVDFGRVVEREGFVHGLLTRRLRSQRSALAASDRGATISHLPSGSYFRVFFSGNALAWTVHMKVDYGPQTQKYSLGWGTKDSPIKSGHDPREPRNVVDLARTWAEDVAAPDFWSDLVHGQEFLGGSGYERIGNRPFSVEEQAEIAAQLRRITDFVKKTYALSGEQSKLMEERFREAEAAAGASAARIGCSCSAERC